MVAKGYAQKEGIDYNEVFSPIVKHSSIRILLALVAQFNMELVQMDVKTVSKDRRGTGIYVKGSLFKCSG